MTCIRKFFRIRFRYEGASWPTWRDVLLQEEEDESPAESSDQAEKKVRLDLEVEASRKDRKRAGKIEEDSANADREMKHVAESELAEVERLASWGTAAEIAHQNQFPSRLPQEWRWGQESVCFIIVLKES